ncbi:LamG-like jellyroll fold domain-containing protein [Helicobacter turcicus]|uniref:Uncharacterized protein n=1 Tax=Helicobacter turcicus TaxID=2867412 RepID=A0ABS7JMK3_9HELI|nr:LamG-like jellyroll fold domain-containing protein [Helicobacter turcicus]MBX7490610.1 hypothetical protein [Helicobacter turcicus]MBX7545482.1 hypothetical protein [Helicobacter turcicus]
MKISKFLAGFLIATIGFSANANEIEVKVGESLSGKKAQEVLKNLSQEIKSILKALQNPKTRVANSIKGGEYPYYNDVIPPFNSTTDSLAALKDSHGNTILFVAYTTNVPVATIGEKATINPELKDRETGEKTYYIQEWNSKTNKLEGRYVNAYEYYNGGHNFNAAYTEWGMPHSNSFGMWIKLNAYFSNHITLFSRNESYSEDGGYRSDYFNFWLLSNGQLSVTSKITDYSVDSLTTTKPIPLGKWVYIQATQNALSYQIGWKTQDGSDEELVSKVFDKATLNIRDCDPNLYCTKKENIQRNRVFDLRSFVDVYVNNIEFRNYINIKEVFYNPDIRMFALMNAYNPSQTLIGVSNGFTTYPINTIIQESYNILTGGTSSILKYEDIDIYYDPNTGNIVLLDWRINRMGAK